MSIARTIERRYDREQAVLHMADPKTRRKPLALRQKNLSRAARVLETMLHMCGHSTPKPLDAYHQKIASIGTTICAWNRS